MGVYLIGVHLMDVYLMNVPLSWASLAGMHLPPPESLCPLPPPKSLPLPLFLPQSLGALSARCLDSTLGLLSQVKLQH
jgi:hypothetical protein